VKIYGKSPIKLLKIIKVNEVIKRRVLPLNADGPKRVFIS
jgi:hypothetical protein